jgi:hypothetical protein
MNNEMILQYLYRMTRMNSGNIQLWKSCYDAWHKFANNLPDGEYEKFLMELGKFNKKYLIKKK